LAPRLGHRSEGTFQPLEQPTTRRISMPQFSTAFSGLANDKKLTNEELIRAIRFMIASEYEATQLYMQLAESTDNKLAIAVLKDIAEEELVHAGEFLRLLKELAPDEDKLYSKGAKEVKEFIKEMK
jgi:rubrerythrin